jgi:hypothetical protein
VQLRFGLRAFVALCALLAPSAQADLVGLTPIGSPGYGIQNYAWGFEFDVIQAIEITGLGYYSDADGLAGSHSVSLWSAAAPASPLLSASVGPATGVSGIFAFAPVSQLLTPGTYAISGSFDAADMWYHVLAVDPGPAIDHVTARYDLIASVYPGAAAGLPAFGPNFTYIVLDTPQAVPAPGSLGLLSIGLLLAAFGMGRRLDG